MAKRTLEFEDSLPKQLAGVLGIIGAVFIAYIYLSGEFIDENELLLSQAPQDAAQVKQKAEVQTRILMSESTRYAQIARYYRDEMGERDLTKAEIARLELVEREQCRLRNQISGRENELCD